MSEFVNQEKYRLAHAINIQAGILCPLFPGDTLTFSIVNRPRCEYCGRYGTLHANCDGCGAQVTK